MDLNENKIKSTALVPLGINIPKSLDVWLCFVKVQTVETTKYATGKWPAYIQEKLIPGYDRCYPNQLLCEDHVVYTYSGKVKLGSYVMDVEDWNSDAAVLAMAYEVVAGFGGKMQPLVREPVAGLYGKKTRPLGLEPCSCKCEISSTQHAHVERSTTFRPDSVVRSPSDNAPLAVIVQVLRVGYINEFFDKVKDGYIRLPVEVWNR